MSLLIKDNLLSIHREQSREYPPRRRGKKYMYGPINPTATMELGVGYPMVVLFFVREFSAKRLRQVCAKSTPSRRQVRLEIIDFKVIIHPPRVSEGPQVCLLPLEHCIGPR